LLNILLTALSIVLLARNVKTRATNITPICVDNFWFLYTTIANSERNWGLFYLRI